MKKINILLLSLLICIACIDVVWLFFPNIIPRKYPLTLTIPIIIICYFLQAEIKNVLYLLALVVFMIADYFFFIEKS